MAISVQRSRSIRVVRDFPSAAHAPSLVGPLPAARCLALEPQAPFHFLGLGKAALARGDLAEAERLLERERAVTGTGHELAFLSARLHAARGDRARAQQALGEAVAHSGTPRQRQVYADKWARLRLRLPASP